MNYEQNAIAMDSNWEGSLLIESQAHYKGLDFTNPHEVLKVENPLFWECGFYGFTPYQAAECIIEGAFIRLEVNHQNCEYINCFIDTDLRQLGFGNSTKGCIFYNKAEFWEGNYCHLKLDNEGFTIFGERFEFQEGCIYITSLESLYNLLVERYGVVYVVKNFEDKFKRLGW